jgi:hypothetical protein
MLHLVPHTHWDREWYEPFQRFRLRLVDLVDGVLDRAEADPRFCFTFDGQTAMLEDYLEIRPEAEPRIKALVATGQLAVGPWRILSDEFLVSGETLVRNLEAGVDRAERFGQTMAVGYLPDEFGHAAQVPQLLRLAGFGHAAVWRGVPAAIDRHRFTWSAPDGSSVRTEYLVGGYGNAAGLFTYPDVAVAGRRLLERLKSVLRQRPGAGHVWHRPLLPGARSAGGGRGDQPPAGRLPGAAGHAGRLCPGGAQRRRGRPAALAGRAAVRRSGEHP